MNHIQRLIQERNEARNALAYAELELVTLMAYLETEKFSGPDSDYVHIRTDLFPKLQRVRSALRENA